MPDLEADHTGLPDAINDTDHSTDSTQHNVVRTSNNEPSEEKSEEQPEYLGTFRLAMVMCTINLSTLIASLDLVSPPVEPEENASG